MVTVFRSGDPGARQDAGAVLARLTEAGLNPALADETQPGVMAGSYEVRVPASERERAEALLAQPEAADRREGDPSAALDMVAIWSSEIHSAEMEALALKSLLDANGIQAFVVGPSMIPSLEFVVQVPRERADEARRVIEEAEAAGTKAAEEGERAWEESHPEGT